MVNKKFKHFFAAFIGVCFITAIIPFFARTINSNIILNSTFTKNSNNLRITEVPPPTSDKTKVNTGIAIVKNGDNFIIPQEYVDKITQSNTLDELRTYIQPYFYEVALNLANAFIPITNNEPIFTISNLIANNREGSISFSVNFEKYVENGDEINSPKSIVATVPGFKSVSSPTNVELNPNFNFDNYSKGDLANNSVLLKQAILINSLPDGATYEITPIYETINNSPNSFEVKISVSKYYDDNFNLVNQEKTFKLTITTSQASLNTEIIIKQNIDKSMFPCFVTKEIAQNFVYILNAPKDSVVDIVYDENMYYDNKKGEISFDIVLSKIYQGGVLVDGSNKPFKVKITGFLKVLEPSTLKAYDNFKDFKPSDVKNDNIGNYLDTSSFPNGVVFSGGDLQPNNKEGILTISNLSASMGFANDERYSLVKQYIIPTITIDGLLTQQPTIINVNTQGDQNILADSLNNLDILNNYVTIQQLPPNTDVEIRDLVADNLKGEISFNLYLSKYYDEFGLLKLNYNTEFKITNFKKVISSRVAIKEGVDFSNIYASSLNENNIKNYVEFISFPETANLYSFEFNDVSDVTGSLTFSFYATQWYDENGLLKPILTDEVKNKKFEIQLTGFAQQSPTSINKLNIDNSNKLASEIDTNEEVANLVEIVNPSNKPGFETYWTAGNFRHNNLLGTLSFTITLNNYFDEKGILRSINDYDYSPMIVNFEFNNFKVINRSIVSQISAPSNILPSDMTKKEVVNYIDLSTFPSDATFKYKITNPININGTFDLIVNATKWFNDEGELITFPADFFITIIGCKTQQPTSVIVKETDLSNVYATEIDSVEKLSNLIEIINPYGEMQIGVDWTATNFFPLNVEGKLIVEVVVNEYYDQNGNPITILSNNYHPLIERITIDGFRKTEKSILLQNSVDNSQVLASDVKRDNSWEKYVDFSRFPDRREILSSQTFASDLKGLLIVDVSIKYYYNEFGNEMTDKKTFRVELKGFKLQTKVTTISPIDNIEKDVSVNDAYYLFTTNPSEFINKYISVTNAPPKYNITVNSVTVNNNKGTINIFLTMSSYYDDNGNLSENLKTSILVQGFKKITSSSIVQNEYYDFSNVTPEEFKQEFLSLSQDEQQIKFKEITTFSSVPASARFVGFNLTPINNLGQLSMDLIATEFYDSNGNITRNFPLNILFKGFKSFGGSRLILNNFNKNFPATDLSITTANFWDYFDVTRFPSDVVVTNVVNTYSNKNGTLGVSATFNKYYGIDGNAVNDNITLSTEISGFKKITSPSTLLKNKNISQELLSKSPSDVILNDKNVLFDKLVDTSLFPSENAAFGINGTSFIVSNPTANNLNGTIEFNVTADKFYSGKNYNLIIQPNQFKVVIDGFLKTQPSTIKIASNKLPSQVTYDDLTFINFPQKPTPDQVEFGIRNDQNGFIEIIINDTHFYNDEGILSQNSIYKYWTNLNVDIQKDNTSLILGLSIGLGLTALVVVVAFIWWRWYKKTHEI